MNLLSRQTDYALQALCYLSQGNALVSVSELCSVLNLPRAFTRGLLQKLAVNKYVFSIKGKNGGFKIALPAKKITVAEIMQLFQGPFGLTNCLLKDQQCARQKTCKLRAKFKCIGTYLLRQLASCTVADLNSSM